MEIDQYDATLGGTEHLPFSAHSLKFATSRSIEIAAMTESIERPSITKLIFQTLPVHMRRRVMSHNCKRLPRIHRAGHMEQLNKSGMPPRQKRPSRKYRRRPGNLLEEYNRRKMNNIWLETHIWHAKRFHMVKRWGHSIAWASCDKAFRACYRGSSTHCLMQDISYLLPIQITGKFEVIKEKFQQITNSSCNLGICSKAYISGSREGVVHLYKPNSYPCGYIGKVNYLWEPDSSINRKLWLFVHPSFSQQIRNILTVLFDLAVENYNVPKKKQKLSKKPESKINVLFLENTYNIFRLTGPNSHAILSKSFKCVENVEQIKMNNWVGKHFANSGSELRLKEKAKFWNSICYAQSPSQLPSKIILGLVVRDPRLMRPTIRTKAVNDTFYTETKTLLSVPEYSGTSPLWNNSILESIKEKRMTNAQFIDRVTKTQLIPGEVNVDDPELQSVPVVLIQRNGSQVSDYKKIGYGSGWDVIVPTGYGLPFWQTFIMFGARAGGLRETENVAFEMGECYLPPDSEAGNTEDKRIEQELKDRFFRLPPSKRINYIKLGIVSPFLCPWISLLNDWSSSKIDDFFVLRDRILLTKIQECIKKSMKLPDLENSNACLVPVYVKIEGKGSLKKHALLCLPKLGDKKIINTLEEPLHVDENEIVRKQLRKEHKQSIKRIRRRNVKNRKHDETSKKIVKKSKTEPSEYVKKMRELWIPSNISSVRNINCREQVGFLTSAAFSFTEAHACGVGYLPYNACQALISHGQTYLLVRNVSSQKYRIGNVQIINS